MVCLSVGVMVGITWQNTGHNNWISVAKPDDRFLVQVNAKASKLYHNFAEACAYNVKMLQQDWDKPFYLMLSGGLDSELVAKALYDNNIPFTPIIVNFGDLNYHERWFAHYWCDMHNIKPITIVMSPDEMFSEIFSKYMKELPRHSDQYGSLITLYIADYIERLGGVCLTGLTDPSWEVETQLIYHNYVDFPLDIMRPGKHPTGFFMYTPEIALSYAYQIDCSSNEQYNKIRFYQVSPRFKYNYAYKLGEYVPGLNNIIKSHVKNMKPSVRFEYGSKEDFIHLLS